jgi:two-component system, OmpR family, phosphate regulon sensor histidine kinase PhoR
MRIFQRNRMPVFLIVASLLLLVAFQVFWLRKEYTEQKSLLQKEADLLFRSTVQAMEDSVIQRKVAVSFRAPKPEETKAASLKKGTVVPRKSDTLVFFGQSEGASDPHDRLPELLAREMKNRKASLDSGAPAPEVFSPQRIILRDSARFSNIEIRIVTSSNKPDSLKQMVSRILKPVQSTVLAKRKKMRPAGDTATSDRFIIRLGVDSLNLDTLHISYAQRLQKAGLQLPFTVRRHADPAADSLSGALPTSPVLSSMPMGASYTASLMEYRPYLFRKITPQILFALFLTAITALAFTVIYRAMQRQQRLMALKNDFISNVTHELKTPIATVSVALEALQNFGAARDPEKIREYLAVSKNELDRLAMLVDKVLKTAQFEQQGMQLSPEPLDAEQLVRQVLNTMTPQLEKYGARYSLATEGADFRLNADRVHLTNVLYNLLDNALKYSEGTPEITLRLSRQPEQLRLEVADRGIGIPATYHEKVFEKFFRVPAGDTHNVKGYGLGLSYVCSVVKSHGGRIEVASQPGQGSCFTVLLPVEPLPDKPNTIPSVSHDTHQTTVR